VSIVLRCDSYRGVTKNVTSFGVRGVVYFDRHQTVNQSLTSTI